MLFLFVQSLLVFSFLVLVNYMYIFIHVYITYETNKNDRQSDHGYILTPLVGMLVRHSISLGIKLAVSNNL